jgi:hypothetical protein
MLVNHLSHGVAKKDHILVKGFNLTLKFDAIDQVNRYGHMLSAQCVQEGVLQKLTFVAHDILRVQKLIIYEVMTLTQAKATDRAEK